MSPEEKERYKKEHGVTDYHIERSERAMKAVAEMMKNPFTIQQAKDQVARLHKQQIALSIATYSKYRQSLANTLMAEIYMKRLPFLETRHHIQRVTNQQSIQMNYPCYRKSVS